MELWQAAHVRAREIPFTWVLSPFLSHRKDECVRPAIKYPRRFSLPTTQRQFCYALSTIETHLRPMDEHA